ncbi:MAG: hypothetical protein FJ265_03190 [Planctomycetes bacterium]|nr:hypothetical protein [Planctomycetota bacterium]
MAQGVRSRQVVALLLAALGACSRTAPPPPEPRRVDTAAIAEADLVAAVLDECHEPLRGRMDRIAADLKHGDGATEHAIAALPDALRIAGPGGAFLVRGGDVWRLGEGEGRKLPAGAEAERLARLLLFVDAVALGPLHRATGCRRLGPDRFELAVRGGGPWLLALRPGTLLPASLARGGDVVEMLDYLRTSTTWMVARARLGAGEPIAITFEVADLAWHDETFVPPAERAAPAEQRPRVPLLPPGAEPRSPTPFLVEGKALERIVLDDPGTWAGRAAAYRPVHEELLRQQQAVPGFPMFATVGGRAVLMAPFRARDGGPRFSAPEGWRTEAVPAGRLLVVYPPEGDFAARRAAGERQLRLMLEQQGLRARGPVVCQPFLHLQEGEPPADKLEAPVVRVSVAVE